jgi:hypothetical protein
MIHCLVNHYITIHLIFALVSTEYVKMCPAIDNPANCEIRAVIRFLHAKSMSAEEISSESCAENYGQNIMNKEILRQCCRTFKDRLANKCSR